MPVDRIAAFLRTVLTFRVEACFLAALVFTLARQADDHRPRVEVRTVTTQHTVHEMTPVRVASGFGTRQIVERTAPVGIAVPAREIHVLTGTADRKLVIRSHSAPPSTCVSEPVTGDQAARRTCSIVRVAPATIAPAIAKVSIARP